MIVYSFPSVLDYVCCVHLMVQERCFFYSTVRRKGDLFCICITSLIYSVLSTILRHGEDYFVLSWAEK